MKKRFRKQALERHWATEEESPEGIAELLAGFVARVFRADGKGHGRSADRTHRPPRGGAGDER